MRNTILLVLLSTSVFAQKVDKTVTFRFSDYKKTPINPTLAAIGLQPDNQSVTVYGWHRMAGDLRTETANTKKEAEEPKKGSKFLGKLVSAATSIETIGGGQSAPAAPSAVPMLSVRSFNAQTLEQTQQSAEFIGTKPLDPANKHFFMTTLRADDDTPGKTYVTTDFAQAVTKYPLLTGPNAVRSYGLSSQGGGTFGTRTDASSFFVTNQEAPLKITGDGKLVSAEAKAPNQEQNTKLLQGVLPLGLSFASPDKKQFIALGYENNKDDSWARYKQFRVAAFDQAGVAVKRIDLNFEFVRNLDSYGYVHNEAGQPTGVYLSFNALTSGAGKKHRDPVENRVNFVYVGFDGVARYQYGFEHGNPEKSRGFNPIAIIDNGSQLRVLSANYDKVLSPYMEEIVLNEKGKVSDRKLDIPNTLNDVYLPSLAVKAGNEANVFVANGMIVATIQAKTAGTAANPVDAYAAEVLVGAFKSSDFTPVTARKLMVTPTASPTQFDQLSSTTPCLVVTTPTQNLFVRLDNALTVTNVTPAGSRVVSSAAMARNYVYDANQQKVYLVYDSAVSGEGKLISVSLPSPLSSR